MLASEHRPLISPVLSCQKRVRKQRFVANVSRLQAFLKLDMPSFVLSSAFLRVQFVP